MNEVFDTSDNSESLKEILELSRENNKMLKKQMSVMRWSRAFSVAYWVVIIGFALGAYYYIQPYIEGVLGIYQDLGAGVQGLSTTIGSVNEGIGSGLGALEDVLKKITP